MMSPVVEVADGACTVSARWLTYERAVSWINREGSRPAIRRRLAPPRSDICVVAALQRHLHTPPSFG